MCMGVVPDGRHHAYHSAGISRMAPDMLHSLHRNAPYAFIQEGPCMDAYQRDRAQLHLVFPHSHLFSVE